MRKPSKKEIRARRDKGTWADDKELQDLQKSVRELMKENDVFVYQIMGRVKLVHEGQVKIIESDKDKFQQFAFSCLEYGEERQKLS